jgi:hypothetical protein
VNTGGLELTLYRVERRVREIRPNCTANGTCGEPGAQ